MIKNKKGVDKGIIIPIHKTNMALFFYGKKKEEIRNVRFLMGFGITNKNKKDRDNYSAYLKNL